ncbi:MAG: LicD family protein [Erysipelotrichaceae bacterium]|nr:LicD family protein [Erysipelotrichaceae bacterium]
MEKYVLKTKKDGSEITVRDVQMTLLEMLKDIDQICQKHQIPYWLNGGSALGAVRHQGFIPWDDDADIAMMQSDFKRFIDVLKTDLPKDKYLFQCYYTHDRYNVLIPGMKIRKRNTYIKEVNTLLRNKCKDEGRDSDGVFVDVFVYDYCSNNRFVDLPFRMFNLILMPLLILLDNIGINPKGLKRVFMRNALLYGRLNHGSKYIGFDLTWTFKTPMKPFIFKKEDIFPVQYVPFEDTMLPIANHPHEYLCTAIAPSYMTLPEESKRFAKHTADIDL